MGRCGYAECRVGSVAVRLIASIWSLFVVPPIPTSFLAPPIIPASLHPSIRCLPPAIVRSSCRFDLISSCPCRLVSPLPTHSAVLLCVSPSIHSASHPYSHHPSLHRIYLSPPPPHPVLILGRCSTRSSSSFHSLRQCSSSTFASLYPGLRLYPGLCLHPPPHSHSLSLSLTPMPWEVPLLVAPPI